VPGLLRRFRLVLVVGGTALSVVSTLGLILDWGSHSARRPAAAASTTSTASTAPTASTAASRSEAPQAFFDRFVAAVRGGDQSFLFGRLHPEVLARYGDAQCRTAAAGLADPAATLRLVNVTGPGTYAYASDGRSKVVADSYTFTADGTASGRTGPRDYHFALVAGSFRIFLDCGTPV